LHVSVTILADDCPAEPRRCSDARYLFYHLFFPMGSSSGSSGALLANLHTLQHRPVIDPGPTSFPAKSPTHRSLAINIHVPCLIFSTSPWTDSFILHIYHRNLCAMTFFLCFFLISCTSNRPFKHSSLMLPLHSSCSFQLHRGIDTLL